MATQAHPKLHVFLAHAGIASRRKSEELILAGKVKVNGKLVTNVADRIDPKKDHIEVDGKKITELPAFVYYLLNKPAGYVSTVSDPDGKKTVMSLLPNGQRIFPVGRLDLESEGLMLFTNNGELAQRLTHPKFEVDKTYHVLLQGAPSNTALNALQRGVRLKEGVTRPAVVEPFKHEHGNTWIKITIHQGLQRQVRRMCANVGLQVMRLMRVSLGPLALGELPPGKWRRLTTQEESALLNT